MEEQDQALVDQVEKDNEFIKHMLDLIPPSVYFDKDTKAKLIHEKKKQIQGLIQGSKQNLKRDNRDLTEKALLKRAKFDPQQNLPVTQIQEPTKDDEEESEEEIEENKKDEKKKKKLKSKTSDRLEDGNYTKIKNKQKSKRRKRQDSISKDPNLKSSVSNLEELREKLKSRIEELKNKRQKNMTVDEIQEKKRLKRKESKLKLKIRKKTEKQNKNKGVTGNGSVDAVYNGALPAGPNKNTKAAKPVFNKEGKMVFSRFDFTEGTSKESKKSNKFAGKDYKKLLQKVEKQKEHVDRLKVSDKEKAKQVQEKITWTSALQRAEGIKVKDNPEMLKKAAKRKDKKKQIAKKHWTEREEKLKDKMEERQKKRQKNIKAKKQAKIDKKIKSAKKRGRIIPGF
ncbi:surfeit locus protein 6 homolog [Lingula anatina]|uniref:Surfeit locus protein 6 homolog n=1 Tax=Lingula anatina TaxID=7574 RepID=A0A1S3KBT4_LINAN|nr:surfeit locus protein 6 homolog [Lingula anatina]|eukprot:XP_013419957.1 surfeit locus protein 6 homolog [Lingula anatina]